MNKHLIAIPVVIGLISPMSAQGVPSKRKAHEFVISQQDFVIRLPEDFHRQISSAQEAVCFIRGYNARYPESLCLSGKPHDLQQNPQQQSLGLARLYYQISQWTEGSGGTETLLEGNLQLREIILAVTAKSQQEIGADPTWSFDYLKSVMTTP